MLSALAFKAERETGRATVRMVEDEDLIAL